MDDESWWLDGNNKMNIYPHTYAYLNSAVDLPIDTTCRMLDLFICIVVVVISIFLALAALLLSTALRGDTVRRQVRAGGLLNFDIDAIEKILIPNNDRPHNVKSKRVMNTERS